MPNSCTEPVLLVAGPRVAEAAALLRPMLPHKWQMGGRYGIRIRALPGDERKGIPITEELHRQILLGNGQFSGLHEALSSGEMQIVELAPEAPSRQRSRLERQAHQRQNDRIPVDEVHPEYCTDQLSAAISQLMQRLSTEGGEVLEQAETSFAFAELFAGIGGFRCALEALGGRCVFASEISEGCARAYRLNHERHELRGDITQIPSEQVPQHDLLVGGFPSAAGAQEGLADEHRGLLFQHIVRILRAKRPRGFLLENVPGLLQVDEGRTFQLIKNAFELEGTYSVSVEAVNARCLTAQSRNRLFFVGIKLADTNATDCAFRFPFIPDLGLIFADIAQTEAELIVEDPSGELKEFTVPDAQFTKLRKPSKGNTKGGAENVNRLLLRALTWHEHKCATLISHYGSSVVRGNSMLVARPWPYNPRRLTPRECARLMGFPDASYTMLQPTGDQHTEELLFQHYRMLGNAVCPPVVCALAGALMQHLSPIPGNAWALLGCTAALQMALGAVAPHRRQQVLRRLRAEWKLDESLAEQDTEG